jgi:hypothetical protein
MKMDRRVALSVAVAGAMSVAACGAAIAANLGILGLASKDGEVGSLDYQTVSDLVDATTTSTTAPGVVVVDEYVTVPAPAQSAFPGVDDSTGRGSTVRDPDDARPVSPVATAPTAPATTVAPTTVPKVDDDDSRDRDREDEREREDDHEREHDDD